MCIHAEGNKKYIYANQYVEVGGFSAGHATTAGRSREGDGPSFLQQRWLKGIICILYIYIDSKQADISGWFNGCVKYL